MTTRKKASLTDRARTLSAVTAASDETAAEPKRIKGIGIRMTEDLHEDLSDISHELGMSLNTLLVEGASAMRDKYLQSAKQAREEREKRKR